MFGITALQLLAYLEVGALPETGEVLRELYGFEARRQELHQQALPAVVYLGCLSHSETFLQSYTQYRRLGSWTIVDADALPEGTVIWVGAKWSISSCNS